jgi:hypothetical protein
LYKWNRVTCDSSRKCQKALESGWTKTSRSWWYSGSSSSPESPLQRGSIGCCISGMPDSAPMDTVFHSLCWFTQSSSLTVFGDYYKSWSSSLCKFLQPTVTSSILHPNIHHSTLFSNILRPCSFVNVRDKIFHSYKITGRVVKFYSGLLGICILPMIWYSKNKRTQCFGNWIFSALRWWVGNTYSVGSIRKG